MKVLRFVVVAVGCLLAVTPALAVQSSGDGSEVSDLLDRAETLLALGVIENGADRSLDKALIVVETARERLAAADLSEAERRELELELEAVREDLELLTELYEKRFYGVFPLARLTIPTLLADEGFALTEELFHPADEAAVVNATRRLLKRFDRFAHPDVVLRSRPADRLLENVAAEVLTRDRRSTIHSRRALVQALSAAELDAFDRGEIDSQLVGRLLASFDAANLLILTIGRSAEVDHGCRISLRGDRYQPGDVISGARVDGEFNILIERFRFAAFARDRRDQYWPILGTHLLMFTLALIWAARVRWRSTQPLRVSLRLVVGAAIFCFGRVFVIAAVLLLGRVTPDPSALVAAAWWWPALLGLLAIIGAGLVAWIGQAQLTNFVPWARGARAVGSIFALVSLGACSYFVAPLLLLDGSGGFANLVPFVPAAIGLAVLFGFAARTGPPVPHYFMIGPLIAAPLVGVSLLKASPRLLWAMVGLTAALGLAAWLRHRYALAHGTEEPEPTAEEAALSDQERLVKLSQRLSKKH